MQEIRKSRKSKKVENLKKKKVRSWKNKKI